MLGYPQGDLPFKYLGIPLSTKKLTLIQWQPLIEKIIRRITSWTAKKLSYAGRVQLVQSIIFGIQAYWAQLFLLPVKVVKTIEAYCRSYIWSGNNTITKKALVAWDKVCCPKSAGGLNLPNLHIWNQAAIAKLHWDLANKQDRLWIRWIHAYYIKNQDMANLAIPSRACWMVRKLLGAWTTLEQIHIAVQPGQSLTKSIYLNLLGELTRVRWKGLIFQNQARPKATFTLWLCCHGKMLTAKRLINWGMNINPTCILCNSCDEDRDHLFAECSYGIQLWNRLLTWIGQAPITPRSWIHHLEWCLKCGKGKSIFARLFKLLCAEIVYAIWTERNMRIFEKRSREVECLAREIAYTCSARAKPDVNNFIQNCQF